MKNVHDFGEPSGGGFIDTHFDFKQCKRSDGTIYGIPDKSSCTQKGSKEVKPSEGGTFLGMHFEGVPGSNVSEEISSEKVLKKLGSQATIDFLSEINGQLTGKTVRDSVKKLSKDQQAKLVTKAYDHLAKIKKAEGKKVPSITSIIPGSTLTKLGLNPDKLNQKAGATVKGPQRKKAAPAPAKPKPSQTWSAGDTKNQYANFYGMLRARGLGHMDAAAAAQDSLRAVARNRNIAIDESMITGELRSQLRKRYK